MIQAKRIYFRELARIAWLPLILFTMLHANSKAQMDVTPLIREAGLNMKRNQFGAALDLYLEAANLAPEDWRSYQGAGNAFFKLDDLDHSLQYYREALALKGEDPNLVKRISQIEVAISRRPSQPPPSEVRPRAWEPPQADNNFRSSQPAQDLAGRVRALEQDSRNRSRSFDKSLGLKITPGKLLSSQFNLSGDNLAQTLAGIDWNALNPFFAGLLVSTTNYSYSVVSNPNVIGAELDFRYQMSPTFALGIRFGIQTVKEPLVVEFRFEDSFAGWNYDIRFAQDEAQLVPIGIQLFYTKIGEKLSFYIGGVPSIYFVSIEQSRTDSFRAGGFAFPIFSSVAKVSGTGFGGIFQAGLKARLGRKVFAFFDGAFETMRVSTLRGQQTDTYLLGLVTTESAVWARMDNYDPVYFGLGPKVQAVYMISTLDEVAASADSRESPFALSIVKLGVGFGLAF